MDEKAIKAEITRYVWVFTEAKKLVGNDESAAAVTAEVGKSIRLADIVAERAQRNGNGVTSARDSDEEAPTEKQLGYLRTLGVQIPNGLSKRAASALIDEATAPY